VRLDEQGLRELADRRQVEPRQRGLVLAVARHLLVEHRLEEVAQLPDIAGSEEVDRAAHHHDPCD
jgi:hypothetical protein